MAPSAQPRFNMSQPATGESMPPESSSSTLPVTPTGSPPGPAHDLGEHERLLVADLDADGERGRVHVDRQRQRADDGGADGARDLHRAHREALVAAARLDLEGRARVPARLGARQLDGGGGDRPRCRAATTRAADTLTMPKTRSSARTARRAPASPGHTTRRPCVRSTRAPGSARQRAAHVVDERALEEAAVVALQEDLAPADEDDLAARSSRRRRRHDCSFRTQATTASPARAISASVVKRDSEKRMTPVSSGTPMARSVADGFLSLAWQADPADT